MEPLLIVDHGDKNAAARGADDFARFYKVEFYEHALEGFTRRRRRTYTMISFIILLFLLSTTVPFLLNSTSIFAYILLALGVIMVVALLYCLRTIKASRHYCKQNFETLFEAQLVLSNTRERAIAQTAFFDDYMEQLVGDDRSRQQRRTKAYRDISKVFETDSIFFFQGMGWIHKERLAEGDMLRLRNIIDGNFSGERYRLVDANSN